MSTARPDCRHNSLLVMLKIKNNFSLIRQTYLNIAAALPGRSNWLPPLRPGQKLIPLGRDQPGGGLARQRRRRRRYGDGGDGGGEGKRKIHKNFMFFWVYDNRTRERK
ncbi:hypothetical protein E2C01_091243 [Portunus trituberculatus]|uniref:Uncharacterized protein n=1 Tax=Portunus trituberculatus TaxID=210409 RepID=A0A5B7JMG4_PORTR|nr:hypothetical protein [Portunus trituberculatus]